MKEPKSYFIFLSMFIISIFSFSCTSLSSQVKNLKSPRSAERTEAVYWLFNNARGETTDKLITAALHADKSEVVRSLAARLMGLTENKKFIPDLEKALNDDSYLVRMEAAQSLGSLKSIDSIEKMMQCLNKEENLWVKLKILKSVDYLKANKSVKGLIVVLNDEEPSVRFQSLALLKKFTGQNLGYYKSDWEKWYKEQSGEEEN